MESITRKLLLFLVSFYYYPLCNWGWDGDADGFYLDKVFNPSEGPKYDDNGNAPLNPETPDCNFKYNIKMITGIRL